MTLGSQFENEQVDIFTPLELIKAAKDFAAEIAGSAERKKKTIPTPTGVQLFLLYVRAQETCQPTR